MRRTTEPSRLALRATAALADLGFGGLTARSLPGVLTLDGALPATDEALRALEVAFAADAPKACAAAG